MTTDRLDPERWRRAVALFERLLDLPSEERERILAEEDPGLRLTVVRMLERDETEDTLLDEGVESLAEITLGDGRPEPEFESGDRVGSFEILGILGRGGMGVVYEARDLRLGRIAALKFLPAARRAAGSDAERLFAEARAASALDHPNIATVYQIGESDGRPFIAMARHDGLTLRDRLLEGPLPRREAIDVAIQVARALAVAHEAGIVHRDVKPGNIFLTSSGVVKLLDFGIAAAGETDHQPCGHGTVRYMSPEQARRELPDARSDVWSLGIVIREMLAGEPVERGGAPAERSVPWVEGGTTAPSLETPGLPGRIRMLVARCLSPDAAHRYRDGTELLEALERCRPIDRGGLLRRIALVAGAAAVAVLAVRGAFTGSAPDRVPLIAVGVVEDREAIAEAAGVDVAGFLTASLARVPDLPLVSNARIEQLRAQLSPTRESAPDRRELAALAGAEVVVEPRLARGSDGALRLELTRLELANGSRRSLGALGGDDVAALLQEGARAVAHEFGLRQPPPVSPLTSASALANRLYEEGLRAYYEADYGSADRFFSSALAEDSTFGMAAFYGWRSQWRGRGAVTSDSALLAVLENARDLPERDRLLIHANWAWMMFDPSARTFAESLATRHPQEPDGHFILGVSEERAARPREAIPHLRQVIEMDSLSLRGATPLCRACDAFPVLAAAYHQIDSIDAAERTLRAWLAHRPESAEAWSRLAYYLEGTGREVEGLAARREEARLSPGRTMSAIFPARAELRAGRWSDADRLLAERIRNGSPAVEREALWFLAISLREQGRLEEALETERVRFERTPPTAQMPPGRSTHFEGQLLSELGRSDEAVEVFYHLADRGRRSWPAGRAARRTAWPTAHLATALAAAGDTTALAVTVDSLAAIGAGSPWARDQRLHHYARGLLLSRRGDLRGAEREFRNALSPTGVFSRINLELGRVLLELGRPREAVQTLQAMLGHNLDGSNLYVSRTELHAALGRAYEAAGNPELAVPHYRWAAEAWTAADPVLLPRRDSILSRLEVLTGR